MKTEIISGIDDEQKKLCRAEKSSRNDQDGPKEPTKFFSKIIKFFSSTVPDGCKDKCRAICYNFILCLILIIPFGLLAGFSFSVAYLLVPINLYSTSMKPISNLDHLQLNLIGKSSVEILDSTVCKSKFKQNVCIEESYYYSIQTQNKYDFTYRIHINEEVLFKKIEINCDSGDKCEVDFKSKNLKSENLFLYGSDLSINAIQIKANHIFFDSYFGKFKAENLIFEQASLNTSKGDIILQTQENVSLSTLTKEKYVCVTSKKYWKNNVSIQNLSEIFEEKDEKTGDCLFVHKYENRDQKSMVQLGQHSVLDRLKAVKYTNSYEIRCNFINELILMSDDNKPNSVEKFQKIQVSNSEGNIYVNVLSNPNQLEEQIANSYFQNSNVKLSQESSKELNNTIRSISDSGKTNEILYLDFRQSSDYFHKFVFVMIFDPIYLFISPSYLSALSFSSLSSDDSKKEMTLQPGICPYIFKYSMTGDINQQEKLVQSNESLILDTINSFLEEENLSPYLIITWEDYKHFKIRDQSTYPDVQNINEKINLVKSIEIICIIIILGFIYVSYIYIRSQLKQLTQDDAMRDQQKIIYFCLSTIQQIDKISDLEQQNPENISQNQQPQSQHKLEIIQDKDEQKSSQHYYTTENLNQKSNNQCVNDEVTKRGCKILRKRSSEIATTFQYLTTRSFIWLQKRYTNSLQLFMQSLTKKEELPQITQQISFSELKQSYQLFCQIFNLQEEYMFDLIDLHEQFELKYDQTIFFSEFNSQKRLKEGEYLVEISQKQKKQIISFIEILKNNNLNCQSLSLSQFYFLYFNQTLDYFDKRKNDQKKDIKQKDQNEEERFAYEYYSRKDKSPSSNKSNQQQKQYPFYIVLSKNHKIYTKKYKEQYQKIGKNSENYFLNLEFLKEIKGLSSDFLMSQGNKTDSDKNINILKENILEKTETKQIKSKINSYYIGSLFEHPRTYFNIGFSQILTSLKINFRTLILLVLYIVSPFIGCGLLIIFIFLYIRQKEKFNIESYSSANEDNTIQKMYNFTYAGVSVLTFSCAGFILFFYSLLIYRNIFTFSLMANNIFEGQFQEFESNINNKNGETINTRKQKSLKKALDDRRFCFFLYIIYVIKYFYVKIYDLLTLFIQLLQIIYLSVGFLILVMGTIIFPKVQLPTLIFYGALIGLIIDMIKTFKTQYEEGKQNLKNYFFKKFKQKANEFLENDEIEKIEKEEEEKEKDLQEVKSMLKTTLFKSKLKNENNKQKENKIKDTKVQYHHDYKDIFDKLEHGSDKQLSEQEFKDFLKNIKMELNQFQLDQLYSKIHLKKEKTFIKFWKLKKQINCSQFADAIEHIVDKKVEMTLHLLDVSYSSLCLSIIYTLFQSAIIAWILYSIFKGISSSDQTLDLSSSFEFNSNSILSIGSVIGLILNKENKGQVFEDEDLIINTIEKVERQMHSDD